MFRVCAGPEEGALHPLYVQYDLTEQHTEQCISVNMPINELSVNVIRT